VELLSLQEHLSGVELLSLQEHLSLLPVFSGGSCFFCQVTRLHVNISVLWCPLRFHSKIMFCSSLFPFVLSGFILYCSLQFQGLHCSVITFFVCSILSTIDCPLYFGHYIVCIFVSLPFSIVKFFTSWSAERVYLCYR
jgi:hypothetical protein